MTEFVVVVEWKVHVLQSMHVEHFLLDEDLVINDHNHQVSFLQLLVSLLNQGSASLIETEVRHVLHYYDSQHSFWGRQAP